MVMPCQARRRAPGHLSWRSGRLRAGISGCLETCQGMVPSSQADMRRNTSCRPMVNGAVRPNQRRFQMAELPPPPEGIVLAHFIVSGDVERSRRFYTEVLGGRVAFSSPAGPTNVALSNSWIVINAGGGPTDDKPEVTLETPGDPNRVSSFVNIRVKDMETVYSEWSARGAQFLTPPKQHQYEIRCYIRDPDGHLIEVGQTTDPEGDWTPAQWPSAADATASG